MSKLYREVNSIVEALENETPLLRALRLTDQPAFFTFCGHEGVHVTIRAAEESVAWLRLAAILSPDSSKRDWVLEHVAVEGLSDEFLEPQ